VPIECALTGLPAWKHGQSGQVGNEAATTVATSAGVGLVNLFQPIKNASSSKERAFFTSQEPGVFRSMNILGIESSCDETGVALVQVLGNAAARLLAHALHSQIDMHQAYGGVVPELASRDHIRRVVPLTRQVLQEAGAVLTDIDCVAYTKGPGLAGALLVGAGVACALAAALDRPTLGVHHLEGHLLSPFLSDDPPKFPFVALLVSGGHTQLMHVTGVGCYELLGETIDDAAGEAFDKSAKLLGLGYPGGAALANLANHGNAAAFALPRPLLHSNNLDFSFAGLKTAVRTLVLKLGDHMSEQDRAHVAASTQQAIVEVLVRKSMRALEQTACGCLVVAGGVGANTQLREQLNTKCAEHDIHVHYPELALCTDNGAMIALAAAMRLQSLVSQPETDYAFNVLPRWPLVAVGGG
jgi:N6-L-threonylcarbamoyladenine synthase